MRIVAYVRKILRAFIERLRRPERPIDDDFEDVVEPPRERR